MDISKQEELHSLAPKLYKRNVYFECGNGWFNIIKALSETLEEQINQLGCVDQLPHAVQVKEKFGTLRFYMSTETNDMSEAIGWAENRSARTCEECGRHGHLRNGRRMTTLCDLCASRSNQCQV